MRCGWHGYDPALRIDHRPGSVRAPCGMPVDTVAPVSEADADDEDNELTDITARGTAIAASARLVNAVQVGMCVGVSLVLPAAVWGC